MFDFDHLIADEKVLCVSAMVSETYTIDELKKEMAKCQLLCASCHIVTTKERRAENREEKVLVLSGSVGESIRRFVNAPGFVHDLDRFYLTIQDDGLLKERKRKRDHKFEKTRVKRMLLKQ
jgi:hypothetical protein